jgi:hypothetical protein
MLNVLLILFLEAMCKLEDKAWTRRFVGLLRLDVLVFGKVLYLPNLNPS